MSAAAVEVGHRAPGATRSPRSSAEKMKTMAALLADPTPIHWDVGTLQALGMGDRPINQGPLNMGYVMNAVTDWAGGPDRLRRLRVRFLGNVLAGDHLRVRGTVTALREEDGARLADCDVVLEVVDGRRRSSPAVRRWCCA